MMTRCHYSPNVEKTLGSPAFLGTDDVLQRNLPRRSSWNCSHPRSSCDTFNSCTRVALFPPHRRHKTIVAARFSFRFWSWECAKNQGPCAALKMVPGGGVEPQGAKHPADFELLRTVALQYYWLSLSASDGDLSKIGVRFKTLQYQSMRSFPVTIGVTASATLWDAYPNISW